MFTAIPHRSACLEGDVAILPDRRFTSEIYFILFLTLSMCGPGHSGSTAKCGIGPIRDFGGRFGTTFTDLHCVFFDVCWHSDGLLFNLTDGQVSGPWPIVISGSSVPHHDGMTIDITPVSTHTLKMIFSSSNVEYVENAILLRRFLPDNLFHVLHDDMLPVYAMKESLPGLNLTLFTTENRQRRFDNYYTLLRLPLSLAQAGTVTCFRRLFVGLPKATLWYQYGFRSPQSTLSGTDVSIVERFVEEVNSSERVDVDRKCTILMRKSNRRILNLEQIKTFLARELFCSVEVISLEATAVELRRVLSATDLLIAMHGAELSLTILLPKRAVVIELFPYAIRSSDYTPYKRLCELLGLVYEPWENEIEENNVAFPEKWLSALTADERLEIEKARVVKPHLCCTDAAWLYRIYQDTKIDIGSLRKVLRSAIMRRNSRPRCPKVSYSDLLMKSERSVVKDQSRSTSIPDWKSFWKYLLRRETHYKPFFYPGLVRVVRCSRRSDNSTVFTWRAPINYGDILEEKNSYFEIISNCGPETLMTRTRKTTFIIPSCNDSVAVWVQAHGGIKARYPTLCEF